MRDVGERVPATTGRTATRGTTSRAKAARILGGPTPTVASRVLPLLLEPSTRPEQPLS
ncbi:hypothetical protein [Streptomyces coeruleorubidus]